MLRTLDFNSGIGNARWGTQLLDSKLQDMVSGRHQVSDCNKAAKPKEPREAFAYMLTCMLHCCDADWQVHAVNAPLGLIHGSVSGLC